MSGVIDFYDAGATVQAAFQIVPSDTQNLPWQSRAFYAGGTGTIRAVCRDNDPDSQAYERHCWRDLPNQPEAGVCHWNNCD